jgi:hypothetical protein
MTDFLDVDSEFACVLILWNVLKLSFPKHISETSALVHRTYTGRGPRPAMGTDAEDLVLLERATFTPTWMRPLAGSAGRLLTGRVCWLNDYGVLAHGQRRLEFQMHWLVTSLKIEE